MFAEFLNTLESWLDSHNQSLPVTLLSGSNLEPENAPVPYPDALKHFLYCCLPGQFTPLLQANPRHFRKLRSKLAGLSAYTIEKTLLKIVEGSLLHLLPAVEKKRVIENLFAFQLLKERWIDGTWHSRITRDPKQALNDLEKELHFHNGWACARFLARCGYSFPHSPDACRGWERYSGKDQSSTPWADWQDLLDLNTTDADAAFRLDRYLDVVFNPDYTVFLNVLCTSQQSCHICPLSTSCHFFNTSLSSENRDLSLNNIRTGDFKEIPTRELLIYLGGPHWFNSPFQNQLLERYPDISTADYQEIESDTDEAFLSCLLGIRDMSGRSDQNTSQLDGRSFSCANDIFHSFGHAIREELQESFYTLILDNKHRIIKNRLITRGTLNQSLVHPREVFAAAIQLRSAAIVLVHNHPSGDPSPSQQDMAITSRLREVGEIVGIKVLDHIIIGKEGYFSFVDEGLI